MPELINYSPATGRTLAEILDGAAEGAVVEVPPGRYVGPFHLKRAVSLRGAGDLTRLVTEKPGPVLRVQAAPDQRIELESMAIEGGQAEEGGGVCLESGALFGSNLRLSHCLADRGGGIAVKAGHAELSRVRIENVEARISGGALYCAGVGVLSLFEGQIIGSQATQGGAVSVFEGGRVSLERVTITRARATTSTGGQVLYLKGNSGASPALVLRRVRFTDSALWPPLVQDGEWPGEVFAEGCDLPRLTLKDSGLVDGGGNTWR